MGRDRGVGRAGRRRERGADLRRAAPGARARVRHQLVGTVVAAGAGGDGTGPRAAEGGAAAGARRGGRRGVGAAGADHGGGPGPRERLPGGRGLGAAVGRGLGPLRGHGRRTGRAHRGPAGPGDAAAPGGGRGAGGRGPATRHRRPGTVLHLRGVGPLRAHGGPQLPDGTPPRPGP
ncbi:conserved hypothetical protein, partial [Streptomyces albidoflavus]